MDGVDPNRQSKKQANAFSFDSQDHPQRNSFVNQHRVLPENAIQSRRILSKTVGGCRASERNTRQLGHFLFPTRQVSNVELVKVIVATGTGHDLHQLG